MTILEAVVLAYTPNRNFPIWPLYVLTAGAVLFPLPYVALALIDRSRSAAH